MKKLLKMILPQPLKDFINELRGVKVKRTPQEVFTAYYKGNTWNSEESISGPGSEIEQTATIITEIPKLIGRFNICSILDIPCGDFNWMKQINLEGINYTGADIVEDLIARNNQKFEHEFLTLDLTADKIPKKDMVLVRDCFVHLSNAMVFSALNNILLSESKYLLTTTFTDRKENVDIIVGDWRPINFQVPPFNFPKPLAVINENCTEEEGIYADKSLAIWSVSDLKLVLNGDK